jgi:hypothetical protein
LALLVVVNAADALRYAPGYISYFNVFVPPGKNYQLLSDSNLDWGQGLLALREYQLHHPDEQISLSILWDADSFLWNSGSFFGRAEQLPEQ